MNKLQELLERYRKRTATAAEKTFVEKYYEHFEKGEDFSSLLSETEKKDIEQVNWERLVACTEQAAPARIIPLLVKKWKMAAAVLLIVAAGSYLWFANNQKDIAPQQVTNTADIRPGREGAILTLDNGEQIILDSLKEGVIANQQGTDILLKDNSVAYAPKGNETETFVYNTLSTPRGRQFHLELPDGTVVWLNAASSIRYPTHFSGKERKVMITGEVYFDVAGNKEKPFIVDVADKATVEVLGTAFNVNAYADEPGINTTLLQGSIKMTAPTGAAQKEQQSAILKPGQQAQISNRGMIVTDSTDLNLVTAWKIGVFQFNFTRIDEVLRQLARWYDLEVVYEKQVPDLEFSGVLRRDYNLSQALTILESMGVQFRVEGNRLIVLP